MASAGSKDGGASRTPTTEELRDSIKCTDCMNALAFCFSPRHQFDLYWRQGTFDTCAKQFEELRFCYSLKTADSAKAKEMLRKLAQKPPSPTEGSVWQARPLSDPGVVAPAGPAPPAEQR
ncbi:hypothetical protein FNF27_00145 [Cafeteria roenbergensis]|uniref:Uncharacterized protein n=1 Tax=Cafeteria roenbergensis TaxID=33653 RepID=A0A5A8DFN4_CAFRO|nr:hypothetical protein FNF29_01274 [Cafeteria roenbergensis]KAA0164226.1 hypothetical protein FNF31_02462 [Cafeteria roenbergensis]KAA0178293.1 hypothetical protein FNF27_00145 [Cafeteria roenbergensis]|eukprot:KAA0155854.1 hypothetical protein FNF29_01274 [Cafeteria roenbergensis]